MRWLIGHLIITLFFCVIAITLAILVGYRQPVPESVAMLHLTDCQLPCWIGITPGATSIDDAGQQIKRFYGSLSQYRTTSDDGEYEHTVTGASNGQVLFYIYLDTEDGITADEIRIRFPYDINEQTGEASALATTPKIGELVSILGHPTYMSAWAEDGGNIPALRYENYHLAIETSAGTNIAAPAGDIFLTSHDEWHGSDVFIEHQWSGFHHYENLDTPK